MVAGPANRSPIHQRPLRLGFILRSLAKAIRLQLGMIRQQVFLQNFDFIVNKIFFDEIRPLLENHNAETVGGKFFRKNAAGRAGTHNDKIDCFRSLVLGLRGFHGLSGSFVAATCVTFAGCQPG